MDYLLAIDQGTTSSRCIIFNKMGENCGKGQVELPQYFPQNGWVEHAPNDIWQGTIDAIKIAVDRANIAMSEIKSIGITNQRETSILWDKKTGEPIYNAIVWQDRRTKDFCEKIKSNGLESIIQNKTGLLLDPYFSASKIKWLLDTIPQARKRAENGELLFGTVDTYLLWKLTEGKSHKTDMTNASRTALFNINSLDWDDELLKIFTIPPSILPSVCDNIADFGQTHKNIFGIEIPITAMAGDQQAALIGQACFKPGMIKATFGTGGFLLAHCGDKPVLSQKRLLTTIGYKIKNNLAYGMEGSIFTAGSGVQWLRDKLGIMSESSESEQLARQTNEKSNLYFIPALTGLGAPYWEPDLRGSFIGITRETNKNDFARAVLEAISYQTKILLDSIQSETQLAASQLRVDGGMVANQWFLQHLADLTHTPIQQGRHLETTAFGIAMLAAMGSGLINSLEEIEAIWEAHSHTAPNEHTDLTHFLEWQKVVNGMINLLQ